MLKIPVSKLKEGMILGQSLFNTAGGSYIVKGQPITMEYIRRLKKIGIQDITVTSLNPKHKLPPPDDIIEEKTRLNAISQVFSNFKAAEQNKQLDIPSLEKASDQILHNLFNNHDNLVQLTDIRLYDNYTFAHSVNVAVLSAMIGMMSRYSKEDLSLITLGALLHDLGKINIPIEILNKNKRLTREEFEYVRRHPTDGYNRIMTMTNVPKPSVLAAIAWQHHEHIDGTGYPRGITGDRMHRFAKVVAVADVYDALTSERPYKKAYMPNIAYTIMTRVNAKQFDPELVQTFFNNVALYPVGTVIKTCYGYAIVKSTQFGKTTTPIIIIFADTDGRLLKERKLINLSRYEDGEAAIISVPTGNDLYHLIQNLRVDPSEFLLEEFDESTERGLPPLPNIPPVPIPPTI